MPYMTNKCFAGYRQNQELWRFRELQVLVATNRKPCLAGVDVDIDRQVEWIVCCFRKVIQNKVLACGHTAL